MKQRNSGHGDHGNSDGKYESMEILKPENWGVYQNADMAKSSA